ncbi:transcription-repair coupling factor [Apibacter sp. HY039]|uniref:transcription-repair coupling factor n=1 Tax=Apibacter sp. HY039 TaxID=2501476 RepID=UPI00351A5052
METNFIVKSIFPHLKNSILDTGIRTYIKEKKTVALSVKGAVGSYPNLFSAYLFSDLKIPVFLFFADKEEAAYALNEIETIFGKDKVLFYPTSHLHPYQIEEIQNANIVLRTEVINRLSQKTTPKFIISYAEALSEKVIDKTELDNLSLKIKTGDQLDSEFLNEVLFSFQFERTDFVTQPGEFSLRGGILDVFSYSDEQPYRIGFFGNEVETIRKFNIETQLSEEKINQFVIVPNIDRPSGISNRVSFLNYLPEDTLFICKDLTISLANIDKKYNKAEEVYQDLKQTVKRSEPKDLYIKSNDLLNKIQSYSFIEFSSLPYFTKYETVLLNQSEQPSFHKQFDLLGQDLTDKEKLKFSNYVIFQSDKQEQRLKDIFAETEKEVPFNGILANISNGFIDYDAKFLIYTDHQIFEKYHRYNLRNSFSKSETITLKELTDLKVGDYVTHIDHGVGKFMGLVKIKNDDKVQETIKLIYRNNDILYVNIHSLHKISRFSGKEGAEVTLNQLGSAAWKNLKNKAKKKVKEVAFDLIKLYAERRTKQGFAYSPDGYLQNELEASFMYEDTPDQEKATQEVKYDMEKATAMDRLVCGDVGFGKTEIAIRAAFKAATDGKQTAIMVPTTILALQHYKTFSKRLQNFPVRVEYLNRFKTGKQKKEITESLSEGKIDIIIGTQQLIGKDVKFKDLGLLIVDEEHKFGVSVKDKLKTLKTTVDTLTLTATPIPRTLQFSLMAARDLSVIKTPPPNRQPVQTQLIGFNEEQIRDAVIYELDRGGQVFFINNRIENLDVLAGMIKRLVPMARIAIGHGQMDGKKLEKIMVDYMEGEYDVLLSTTIIESGLDVPNANTIFINDAQRFGLADLHQMRGRVGRSNRKAFCYLITPPLDILTSEARKRLQAVEQFSDLGSGFNIAMKDLEIRGAGDLLGAEQSGFFAEIGFEAYQQILNEAIEELKENEFSDLFEKENESKEFVSDVQIDTDFELLIPDQYVNNVEERFSLYQKLSDISNENDLHSFENELKDRFGVLPIQTVELLKSVHLKWLSKYLGFEKLVIKNKVLLAYFPSNSQSKYYESETFKKVLEFIQKNPSGALLKQKQTSEGLLLYLRKDKIQSMECILNFFLQIKIFVTE